MNASDARGYVVSSNGNAFVAAWISILDQHKLPFGTIIPPQEWYQAFEELYLSDAVDENVFNSCSTKAVFFSGQTPDGDKLEKAFWNLGYLKQNRSMETIDNEEYVMKDFVFDPPSEALETASRKELGGVIRNEFGAMSMPEVPMMMGPAVAGYPGGAGRLPSPDVRKQTSPDIECHGHEITGKPSTEEVNFTISCCGEEVVLYDSYDSDWYAGDDGEDFDTADVGFVGTCVRCGTTLRIGASIPLPKGVVDGSGYHGT